MTQSTTATVVWLEEEEQSNVRPLWTCNQTVGKVRPQTMDMQSDGWQRETTNYGHAIRRLATWDHCGHAIRQLATWDHKLWTCNQTVGNVRPQTMYMQSDGWQHETTNCGHAIRRLATCDHKLWTCNQTVGNVRPLWTCNQTVGNVRP